MSPHLNYLNDAVPARDHNLLGVDESIINDHRHQRRFPRFRTALFVSHPSLTCDSNTKVKVHSSARLPAFICFTLPNRSSMSPRSMTSSSTTASFGAARLFVVAVVAMLVASLPTPSSSFAVNGGNRANRGDVRQPTTGGDGGYGRRHPLLRRNTTTCTRPSNLEQIFRDLNVMVNDLQFLRPANNGLAITALDVSDRSTHWLTDESVNRTCPEQLSREASAPFEQRALCPYFFDILQLPEGYYPRQFKFARCKCQECVEHPSMSCVPVKTPVTILKANGCLHGLQRYQETQIDVSTSCTCAFKGAVVSSNNRGPAASLPMGEE